MENKVRAEYKFQSIERLMEFCKALLVEGDKYTLKLKTVMHEFPRENDIEYFSITVEENL